MSVTTEFVERYQIELEKNPRSKVFAPLAEAYRKMGLIDEAMKICQRGVQIHPDFAGGLVAYGKLLFETKNYEEALNQLKKAAQLSPDNLLAQSLLGETLLQLRRPKDALKAYKMVLFLSPTDPKALEAVRKWEFLTADEYEDDVFAMRPQFDGADEKTSALELELDDLLTKTKAAQKSVSSIGIEKELIAREGRTLDRAVSLADAFTVRGDLKAAAQVLRDALKVLGPRDELDDRLNLIERRLMAEQIEMEPSDFEGGKPRTTTSARKLDLLETLLRRINERRAPGAP
jgi:tetratricopeptide (TPR) repeat protein